MKQSKPQRTCITLTSFSTSVFAFLLSAKEFKFYTIIISFPLIALSFSSPVMTVSGKEHSSFFKILSVTFQITPYLPLFSWPPSHQPGFPKDTLFRQKRVLRVKQENWKVKKNTFIKTRKLCLAMVSNPLWSSESVFQAYCLNWGSPSATFLKSLLL